MTSPGLRSVAPSWIIALGLLAPVAALASEPLEGTAALELQGDIASQLVEGADRFLLRKLAESADRRAAFWKRDTNSVEAYNESLVENRKRLAHILGLRDQRQSFENLELLSDSRQPALVGRDGEIEIFAVRWPVVRGIHGEGLLLVPKQHRADVVAIPDADQTPEMIAGLVAGVPLESQYAHRLAQSGCRVLVPTLVSRDRVARNGRAKLTNREYLYRPAFELGRHVIGYELQKVLAGVDFFAQQAADKDPAIGVFGWGEGGMLALYAGALDGRIDSTCVSGYFDRREEIWQQPIDRNVFGLLERFGDAELAAMVAPRALVIEACRGPELEIPGEGGAPGRLVTPTLDRVRSEFDRAQQMVQPLQGGAAMGLVVSGDGEGAFATAEALGHFLHGLSDDLAVGDSDSSPEHLRTGWDPAARQQRQIDEIQRDTQWLLQESPYVRQEFVSKLSTGSLSEFQDSSQWYRDYFRDEVIGHFDDERLPPAARTRKAYDEEKWVGYEVVLDVFPDVIAYGILLLPKDIADGERRPVVVCQHGLEGRPQEVVAGDHPAYHDFAARLAERGFITFAPQNLYIFGDRFRTLQRKANPLKKTLFSIMVPQHQQIVEWLGTLPQVDPQRIAFYGLSYGGKSAMRIPPLVDGYCLSICSADFNDWVWKNASTRSPYSYVWTGEYEIFEFDLGSTFNYAEMAALIAPRPFMVERGHFDGVAPDERVAYEFAKVRHLYSAKLGIGDRCAIEWFVGPHTIHGVGTFDFLHEHLDWPKRHAHR